MKNWTEEKKKAYEKQLEKWQQEELDEITIFQEACKRFNEMPDSEVEHP